MAEFFNKSPVNNRCIPSIRSQDISKTRQASTVVDTFGNRVKNNLLHLIGINHCVMAWYQEEKDTKEIEESTHVNDY